MEDSCKKFSGFSDLNEMYTKIKTEVKDTYDRGEQTNHTYYEPLFKRIEDMIEEVKIGTEEHKYLLALKSSLYYEHAKILTSLQEQFEIYCLQTLKEACDYMEEYKIEPDITYLYFRILNLLSYTLSKSNQTEDAIELLETAEKFYDTLTNKVNIMVYTIDELFEFSHITKRNNEIKFERLITNNLQMQAWIYNKLNMSKKFLKYHHLVLNRQLEYQDGNAITWFYKCARLGVYFFSNNKFIEGKHHLAAACIVLRQYELEILKQRNEKNEKTFIKEWNNMKKYYADIGKYWSKYGLFLFHASRHLAVSQVSSELSINDILINAFQDYNAPSKEWFNIRRNSMFFPPKKLSKNCDKHKAKHNYKNQGNDLNEQKPNELSTDIPPAFINKKTENSNIENKIQSEINKLNDEVDNNESEEITEVTKMLISALDDRQKEVEEVVGDHKTVNIHMKSELNYVETKFDPGLSSTINDLDGSQHEEESTKSNSKSNISDTNSTSSKNNGQYEFKFPSLDLSAFRNVPATFIESTENARDFFMYIQEWVKRAKSFYTLQDSPIEYVQLILDLNELYRYLSLYETDLDNQYDVQRRRVEILESLSSMLRELKPKDHLYISIELLQELTQAQIDLLMLNIRRLSHVQSSGNLLLKDICQEHNEANRKIEALSEIQRRLGRKNTRLSMVDMQLFG